MDILKTGGSYELFEKLWAQFVLTAGQVNAENAWNRNEVVVNSVIFVELHRLIPDLHCCFAFSRLS